MRFKSRCKGVECTPPEEFINLGQTPCPIKNGDSIEFCIPQPLEPSLDNVVLVINEVEFPLYSCATNRIKADQLKTRRKYRAVLGTEQPSARLLTRPCPTAFVFPVIPTEPEEEAPAEEG